MDLPERFQGEDEGEDAARIPDDHLDTFVQHSVFGILAGMQDKERLMAKVANASDDEGESAPGSREGQQEDEQKAHRFAGLPRDIRSSRYGRPERSATGSHHRKTKSTSESRLLKSVLAPMRDRDTSAEDDHMIQSQLLPPRQSLDGGELNSESDAAPEREIQRSPSPPSIAAEHESGESTPRRRPSRPLSEILAEIFHLEDAENVVAEHQCWYLHNVLLQGHMYITTKHVCFYAYLPKKGHLSKSGYLDKQGKHGSRRRRYWFTLKGNVLSYFVSASEPFFPAGTLDLRYATSADLVSDKARGSTKDASAFTVTTDDRIHRFAADTPSAASEWVRELQRVIFRARNEGDSIKIVIPVDNIMDVEQNPMLDMAETVKIRAMENEGTYAVDEYFFTFFSGGDSAFETLSALAEKNATGPLAEAMSASRLAALPDRHRRFSGMSSQAGAVRAGAQGSRQRSRAGQGQSSMEDSTSSMVVSSIRRPDPNASSEDSDDDMSASQMLRGDAAFRNPTLRLSHTPLPIPVAPTSKQPLNRPSESQLPTSHQSSLSSGASTARTVAIPFNRALTIAEAVRTQGKRMSSYLSSSPKNYYEKLSGALAGGKRHYSDAGGLGIDDGVDDPELDLETAEHERRFQQHFALPPTEKLRVVYYCSLHRVLPLYGKVYISDRRFCFRSLLYGTRTKLIVPFREIDNVTKEKGFRWGYPGMVLVIRRHEELFFDFGSNDVRDDCVVTILRTLDVMKVSAESTILTHEEQANAGAAAAENQILRNATLGTDSRDQSPENSHFDVGETLPMTLNVRPPSPMRITCLTVGSRGDVQPYIALCKGLMADGHQVKIATHAQFETWIRSHGIDFEPVAGDPAELMRMCVENGMFTPSFIMEATSKFSDWLDGLLETSWKACANSDLLIESPCAMGGLHIAEALGIPYFRAFTMPWTRTRAYPHAFARHGQRLGGQYNYTSYTVFDFFFWMMMSSHINRWRKTRLGLHSTDLARMQTNKVPFLYNFSPSVVPPPLDFSDWINITGYWFLDEGDGWKPPADLKAFISQARADRMKLVYIGFGSVPVSDSKALTQQIIEGVLKADVRCILSKGWSDHFTKNDPTVSEVELPPSIFQIRAAPHDWLFKQIDAVVHHGGAGTTGASLRVGLPTIIKPFFGDQFFFASRIEDLGVGIHLQQLTAHALGKAIWCATHDERMCIKARLLGERIRAENGVQTAINAIYRDLDYARTLIKKREIPISAPAGDDGTEESWTFIENDSDVETSASGLGLQTAN